MTLYIHGGSSRTWVHYGKSVHLVHDSRVKKPKHVSRKLHHKALQGAFLAERESEGGDQTTTFRTAYNAVVNNGPDCRACFVCGETGHMKRECPRRSCFTCGKVGHLKKDCPGATQDIQSN